MAVHIAALLQWGGMLNGFHDETRPTRLNIRLSEASERPTGESRSPGRLEAMSPARMSVAADGSPGARGQDAAQRAGSAERQAGEARQLAGDMDQGIPARHEQRYLAHLLRHLDRFKDYPVAARRRHLEGEATMRILLDGEGRLLRIECLSGGPLFCRSATRTVRAAVPLPPPQSRAPLQFRYAMEYRLRR